MPDAIPETVTYTARWVFPVAGPPLWGGTVTVTAGRIAAVEPAGVRTADVDFGNAALIPGLGNAHTHLDLSGARGLIPPTDPDHFTDWLRGVIAYRRSRSPEQVQADIRTGLAECLRSGTTLLGDITADGGSWDALAAAPLRSVVFREFIGLNGERVRKELADLFNWKPERPEIGTCRPAVSPHSPYSVRADVFRSLAWNGYAMAIHLAESPGELELIHSATGPFVEFLTGLGVWEPGNFVPSIDWLLWRTRTRRADMVLFAHCNYLPTDAEFWANQSVVYCPRTHAAFGHPPHPFREFLRRGVRVCLGTDSLASNPDLDVLAEARFVAGRYPDFPRDTLLRMVTLAGAEALGWADEAGSLEAGKSADFVAVPLPDRDTADPHELLFADHPGERRTVFRGVARSADRRMRDAE
jgi:cytosine/adenosine deaminase-related metal-dependent hydrolase